MNVTKGQVLRYTLTPQILPRVQELTSTGFGYVAFFMALVYRAVGLLPSAHPYVNARNIGLFTMRQVIAEAANNLKFSKDTIDQVVVFALILVGLVLLFIQVSLMILALFVQGAHAADMPGGFGGFFITPDPTYDIAHMLMDRVFGIPNFFNSCVAKDIPCWNTNVADSAWSVSDGDGPFPYPFHAALHDLMAFYSIGLLVIAMLLFLYFIAAVVAETAQTGTPFGKRFNHVWAPLRLVVALGLLIPIGNGLNSAQYITLHSAKFGSAFATNGWNLFTDKAISTQQTLLGDKDTNLVAVPNPPKIGALVEFFSLVATCKHGYNRSRTDEQNKAVEIEAYLINGEQSQPRLQLIGTSFEKALEFFQNGNIIVRFGEYREYNTPSGKQPVFLDQEAFVNPSCGEVIFQINDVAKDTSPGSWYVQEEYYKLLQQMWLDATTPGGNAYSENGADLDLIGKTMAQATIKESSDGSSENTPTLKDLKDEVNMYKKKLVDIIKEGTRRQAENAEWLEDLKKLGWGGGGIWYNKIAQLNGAIIGASYNLPYVSRYPVIMEFVYLERKQNDVSISGRDRFRPTLSGEKPIRFNPPANEKIAIGLYQTYKQWNDFLEIEEKNPFLAAMHALLGTEGLFNLRSPENKDVHPMAQLTTVGKTLIDSAIRNLGFSIGGAGISMILRNNVVGKIANIASSFVGSVAMIGLSLGFILYYIIPFLPFIYFFFAVGGWIKGIFEAMVGVPLWALAHIRIDGDGLPGQAALNGYLLVFEIFLRPILIVFGMLAGISIFGAQVKVLNEIWSIVTENAGGFDKEAAQAAAAGGDTLSMKYLRGIADQFFYTIIYAIICYMLALSSFKLVDLIPNNIMRWMGHNVTTFGDENIDPAENLVRNTSITGGAVMGQLGGAARESQKLPGQMEAAMNEYKKRYGGE
jgi:conjugal transfer/type IV secretion protein DotA/TraY